MTDMESLSMAKNWTGRERMKVAMSGKCPDRVPTMPQICHPHAVHLYYDDYRRAIAEVMESPQLSHELILRVAQLYDLDGIRLFCLPDPVKIIDDGELMIALDPQTGQRLGRVDLLGGAALIPDQEPRIESPDDLKIIPQSYCEDLLKKESFAKLAESTARAHQLGFFVASDPTNFTIKQVIIYRGREQTYMDLATNPTLAEQIMDISLAEAIEHAKANVGCGVDALYIGDPSSSCSLISPQHWERFCLPRFRTFCRELHKYDVLIYIHVCGNSTPILEMMADTGADCIEPLDPLGGVEVADAKRRVGDRVTLMGGVNPLTILRASPEEVYEEATSCCRDGGQNGAYILAAGDMVPDSSPQENVQALVQAAKDFKYQEAG